MFENNRFQELLCPKCGTAMKISEDVGGTGTVHSGSTSSTASISISQTNSYLYICPKCGARVMSNERLLGPFE